LSKLAGENDEIRLLATVLTTVVLLTGAMALVFVLVPDISNPITNVINHHGFIISTVIAIAFSLLIVLIVLYIVYTMRKSHINKHHNNEDV